MNISDSNFSSHGTMKTTSSYMEIGLVVSCIDATARVVALDSTFVGELLTLSTVRAITINLEFVITGLSVLGNDRAVEQADIAERTFAELLIEVGFYLIGRVIDPIANFLDEIKDYPIPA